MELPGIFSKPENSNQGEEEEVFLALGVAADSVQAAIWLVEGGQVKIEAVGEAEEWEKQEELIEAADKSIASAASNLTRELGEPQKVVFGLPSSWVADSKIVPQYLEGLRQLSKKLELAPAGFVVVTEAITQYLKNREGSPPTAILLEVAEEEIVVSVVSQGKILASHEVGRSDNLAADVIEALSRFDQRENLPSRFLIYNARQDLEAIRQKLLDHDWLKPDESGRKLPFLHFPKIEIMAADFALEAVARAGGAEVARAAGVSVAEPKVPLKKREEVPPEVEEAPEAEAKVEVALEAREEAPAEKEPPAVAGPAPPERVRSDFGFVAGADIRQIKPTPAPVEAVGPEPDEELQAEGVVSEKEEIPEKAAEPLPAEEVPTFPRVPINLLALLGRLRPKTRPSIPRPSLPIEGFKRPGFGLPSFKVPALSLDGRGPLVLIIIGLLFLLLGGVALAGYWFFPKAEVTLMVETQTLEKELSLTIDPGQTGTDPVNSIIPGQAVSARVSGEKTAATTGTKLVGEEASGEVTIYNNTASRKTFPEGTTISGPGGLKFALDAQVVVASESGAPDYKPGEAKVGVTAADIGAEGNLAAGTVFSVATFSTADYSARNEAAFTGGSSRQIQAVSEEDQGSLVEALTAELTAQAAEKIRGELSQGQRLVDASLVTEAVSDQFSHEVGEEATELTYSLEIEVAGLAYQEADLENLVDQALAEAVPAGFEVKKEATELVFDLDRVTEDGGAVFGVAATAYLLPKVNLDEVAGNLAGKRPEVAEEYLRSLPAVTGVEAKISPNLPAFARTMPRVAKNIKIEMVISAEE